MNTSQQSFKDNLEKKLEEFFVTKSSVQLPVSAREMLVKFMPWLTLLGAVAMLMAAWGLFSLVAFVGTGVSTYGYGVAAPVTAIVWISFFLLGLQAVLLFIAFPALRAHKKRGWDMLFYVSLIGAASGVVQLVVGMDFGGFLWSIISFGVGLFFLFQIRSYYVGKPVSARPADTKPKGHRQ